MTRLLLAPHLYACGFTVVGARLLGSARLRDRRGGIRSWQSVRSEITNHLKQDPGCYATTMVDFYALPSAGARAWPGRAKAAALPFAQKAAHLEQALREDLQIAEGTAFDPARFIPPLPQSG